MVLLSISPSVVKLVLYVFTIFPLFFEVYIFLSTLAKPKYKNINKKELDELKLFFQNWYNDSIIAVFSNTLFFTAKKKTDFEIVKKLYFKNKIKNI